MYARAFLSPSLSLSLSLEKKASLFSRESSYDPSSIGPLTSELALLSHEEPRSEGYDEYFDPPLERKYECPICLSSGAARTRANELWSPIL